MQKTLLFLWFTICSLGVSLSAQDDYHALVVENAHWKICQSYTEEIWDCGLMYEYLLRGDTLIDNLLYKRLYYRSFQNNGLPGGGLSSYDTPFLVVGEAVIGFMREDVSARKVYYRALDGFTCGNTAAGEETLLYDFALAVGDTLQGCLTDIYAGEPPVIADITMENWYGQDRKTYHLEGPDANAFVLIEGIGFSGGLLTEPFALISGGYTDLWDHCVGNDMDCNISVPGMMVSPYQEWHLLEYWFSFSGNFGRTTFEYRFGDTLQQNNHTYFRLEKRAEHTQASWNDTPLIFRQEGQQVYRVNLENPTEGELLLYDFSLNLSGTPLPTAVNHWLLNEMELFATDSVTLTNGDQRKRFIWENPNFSFGEYTWVEGIGANDHPFVPERSFEDEIDGLGIKLLCFYESDDLDEPLYLGEVWDGSCAEYVVDTDEQSATNRKIYPNPFQTQLQVEGAKPDDYLICTSAAGQLIGTFSSEEMAGNEHWSSQLSPGLYFYQWFNIDHQLLQTGKLIKLKQ